MLLAVLFAFAPIPEVGPNRGKVGPYLRKSQSDQ